MIHTGSDAMSATVAIDAKGNKRCAYSYKGPLVGLRDVLRAAIIDIEQADAEEALNTLCPICGTPMIDGKCPQPIKDNS